MYNINMNPFDVIALSLIVVSILTTIVMMQMHRREDGSNFARSRNIKEGREIHWKIVYSNYLDNELIFQAYGFPNQIKYKTEISKIRWIKKSIKNAIKFYNLKQSVSDFSYDILNINLSNWKTFTDLKDAELNFLTIEQIVELRGIGLTVEHICHLKELNIRFEDIKASKGTPTAWAAKIFS